MIALLQATLAGLLAASAPLGAIPGAGDGRSMAIRGEAGTVDELALALFADLQDQADALDCAVAGIEIAGMVRSEVGLFGWGYALLAAEPALALAPLRVVNREIVSPPAFGLTFTLERGGVDDSPCPR